MAAVKEWRCGRFVFPLNRPLLMGVVNATPDSFSDGGRFCGADAAVARGLKLCEDGADIIDVGGESTRPGAAETDIETEKKRALPVIEELAKRGAAVSADTRKPEMMRAALDCGASVLNDICGFCAPEALSVAAKSDCGLVAMHMQGAPQTMQTAPQYIDVAAEVGAFLRRRTEALAAAGADAARICVDPGIGFGKTAAHNLELLRRLPELAGGFPVLVGVSRKSLIAALCRDAPAPPERDVASATAAALLAARGANVLRVHNVAATRDALAVYAALMDC